MYTEETMSILDDIDVLSDMIVQSELYYDYREAQERLNHEDEAHLMYQAFLKSKMKYDEVMRFGKYHPDYQNVMMDTRRRKRAYEMLPVVMDYKSKEVALQNLIDEVVSKIAFSVSENVKIEAGNPFFKTDHNGCATGGTCNCSL
ncbi:YlbF family regulator [Staphylococcus pragensis]|uniref:YlbF family regulator n=1 Tax=Staphylococcus pragensis TaxID=1611836 RepID=A0A4Z1C886_9STAP|nr:YlbF family regulator [Staphylococcus pragensis]RTX90938.1 YlbF family regulator [Staphylococcus carnosus]TGN28511.1 YlbF family regulator [Staphylococcus pragensis]GGG87022.1 regulator [Staphylococcus pragensis]